MTQDRLFKSIQERVNFQENYRSLKVEILDYLRSVNIRPDQEYLKKEYEEAMIELEFGSPESVIRILEQDYSYQSETTTAESKQEKKKLARYLDFLKNHFRESET